MLLNGASHTSFQVADHGVRPCQTMSASGFHYLEKQQHLFPIYAEKIAPNLAAILRFESRRSQMPCAGFCSSVSQGVSLVYYTL